MPFASGQNITEQRAIIKLAQHRGKKSNVAIARDINSRQAVRKVAE